MPSTSPSPPSPRVRAIRQHDRARYDRATIDAILDEALVAHLGFVLDDQPFVIPTLHARVGDQVYVHGSAASRTLRRTGGAGVRACLTVTLLDGLVLARSVFEHDVQYRSAVLLGELRPVEDADEKLRALEAFTEAVLPGRWDEARSPSRQELKATSILAMPIDEASAKVAADGPEDADGPDGALDVWAGWIPLRTAFGDPVPDPRLRDGIPVSAAARRLVDTARARDVAGQGATG